MNRRSLLAVVAALGATVGLVSAVPTASAQPPQIAALPDGMVAIHYHRPAGDYKDWGLHVWRSYEPIVDGKMGPKAKADRPLEGVGWGTPMPPTGTDGFGIYWHLKAADFENGKVNYIIHKWEVKNCASDLYFMTADTKEVFAMQRDCNQYKSADEALKSAK